MEFDWDRGLRIKVVILQIYLDMQYVGWNFENYSVFWDCYLWQNLCQTEAEFRNDNSPLIRDTLVYEIIAKLETEWKWRSFTELWHVRYSLTKHSTLSVKMRKKWSFLEKNIEYSSAFTTRLSGFQILNNATLKFQNSSVYTKFYRLYTSIFYYLNFAEELYQNFW